MQAAERSAPAPCRYCSPPATGRRHAGQRHVELPLVLFLTAGSVLGVQVGVRLARRFRGPRIRCLFAGVDAPGHGRDRLGPEPATACRAGAVAAGAGGDVL